MNGPVCRYQQGITVIDVIPVDDETIDETNPWYPLAISTAWSHTLSNGITIKVIEPVCFLGTKLAAFNSATREYHGDVFRSRDFEDIVRVTDGRPSIVKELAQADANLRMFLKNKFAAVLRTSYLEDYTRVRREGA